MTDATLPRPISPKWTEKVLTAKAVANRGVVRRAIRDVEREVGRAAFELEVRRCGFHLIECETQYVVICNPGRINVIC